MSSEETEWRSAGRSPAALAWSSPRSLMSPTMPTTLSARGGPRRGSSRWSMRLPSGSSPEKKLPRRALAQEDDLVRTLHVPGVEATPFPDGDAHRLEVVGRRNAHLHGRASCPGDSGGRPATSKTSWNDDPPRGKPLTPAHRAHAGQRSEARHELAEERRAARIAVIDRLGKRDPKRQGALGPEPGIDVAQAREAADQETGPREQHHGQGHLADDEAAPEAGPAASEQAASPFAQHLGGRPASSGGPGSAEDQAGRAARHEAKAPRPGPPWTSARRGTPWGWSARSASRETDARNRPAAPPRIPRSTLSVRSCRSSRPGPPQEPFGRRTRRHGPPHAREAGWRR